MVSRKTPSRFQPGTRSYTMSRIRGTETSIERQVRSYLFSRGLRFRKNDKRYPGHPDVVLPKWRAMVFVNGCFWHMHQGCAKFSLPKSNVEYWTTKLTRNRLRDQEQGKRLKAMGWRVFTVWECQLDARHAQETLQTLYEAITADGDSNEGVKDEQIERQTTRG